MKRCGLILVLLMATVFLSACSSSSNNEVGTVLTVGGHITSLDWDYTPLPGSDALVTLDGTSFSAKTSADGDWSISNVPEGVYSFTFSKSGFETIKRQSIRISASSDEIREIKLAKPPTAPVILDGVTYSPNPQTPKLRQIITLYGHYPTEQGQNIRMVLSYSPHFDIHDTTTYFHFVDGYTADQTSLDTIGFTLEFNQPDNNVFLGSDTIYVTAYVTGVPQNYYDSKTSKYYFTGFGPKSNTLVLVK